MKTKLVKFVILLLDKKKLYKSDRSGPVFKLWTEDRKDRSCQDRSNPTAALKFSHDHGMFHHDISHLNVLCDIERFRTVDPYNFNLIKVLGSFVNEKTMAFKNFIIGCAKYFKSY